MWAKRDVTLQQNLLDRVLSRLNASNVGFTPNKSHKAFGPRDVSGVKPPFSVFNLYLRGKFSGEYV